MPESAADACSRRRLVSWRRSRTGRCASARKVPTALIDGPSRAPHFSDITDRGMFLVLSLRYRKGSSCSSSSELASSSSPSSSSTTGSSWGGWCFFRPLLVEACSCSCSCSSAASGGGRRGLPRDRCGWAGSGSWEAVSDCLGRPRRFGRESSIERLSSAVLSASDDSLGALVLLPCCGCNALALSESSLLNDGRPRRFLPIIAVGWVCCAPGDAASRDAPFARVLDFPLSRAAVGCASCWSCCRLPLGTSSGSLIRRSRPLRLGAEADGSSSVGDV